MTRLCEKRAIHRFTHSAEAPLCVKKIPPYPPRAFSQNALWGKTKNHFSHTARREVRVRVGTCPGRPGRRYFPAAVAPEGGGNSRESRQTYFRLSGFFQEAPRTQPGRSGRRVAGPWWLVTTRRIRGRGDDQRRSQMTEAGPEDRGLESRIGMEDRT